MGAMQPPQQTKNKMTSTIITADRYIILPYPSGEYIVNKTIRVLTKTEDKTSTVVVPCRWNNAHKRLESVALNNGGVKVPFMYEKTAQLAKRLEAAPEFKGYKFLTLEQAEEMTK